MDCIPVSGTFWPFNTPLALFSRKQVSVALYRIFDADDGLTDLHGPQSMTWGELGGAADY
jgi:hypothetical protein